MTHRQPPRITDASPRRVARESVDAVGDSRLAADRRGASAVLGTMLAFALVVSLVAMVQVSAVPAWNQQSEFQHLGTAESQYLTLDQRIAEAATGTPGRATLEPGVDYPTRALFVSPAAGSGTIRTTDPATTTISHAVAVGTATDYWNGSTHSFDSEMLLYQPDYRYLQNDPVLTHEGSVRYTKYDSGDVGATQSLVDGTRISLVLLEGDVDLGATDATTFSVVPLSAGTDYITVTNDADPIRLSVATRLSNETWTDLLASEPNAHVASYVTGPDHNTVVVELVPGKTYDLHVARVGIDTAGERQPPAYVVAVSGDGASLPPGAKNLAVVEVRDAQNNPVVNATVRASTGLTAAGGRVAAYDSGGLQTVTDENGRATFVYTAPGTPDGVVPDSFDVVAEDAAGAEVDRVTFDVETREGGPRLPTRGFVTAIGDPGFAYADVNGNGLFDGADWRVNATTSGHTLVYDAGDERLVVPPSVRTVVNDGTVELSGDGVSIHVDVVSTGGDVVVDAGSGSVDAVGVSLTSATGSVSVLADDTVDLSGASLGANGDIVVSGRDGVQMDNAALTNEKGGSSAEIVVGSDSGAVSARSADLSSKAGITVSADGTVDLTEAGTSTTQGGDFVVASANAGAGLAGIVSLTDGAVDVHTAGNVDLQGASVTTVGTDSKRTIAVVSDRGGIAGKEAALVTENDIDLTASAIDMTRATLDAGAGDEITVTFTTSFVKTDASIDGTLVENHGGGSP